MQEIHSITGGRFFGGGGERRLRPHHHHQNHQALKCPRCDSLNTKFCYYNNYNLSQPRHFCKNCRRYWTKGGVLRNVPVGGGCRKSKRSNNKPAKSNFSSSSETATAMTTSTTQPATEPQRRSNSHSSSESSSLTAAAAAASTAMETTSNSISNNELLDNNNFHEAKLFSNPAGFELEQGGGGVGDCSIYSEIGSFTSLITCRSSNEALGFGFGNNIFDASPFRFSAQRGTDPHPHAQCQWQQQKVVSINSDHHTHLDHQDMKFPDITGSLLDQTVPVGHGGFGCLDWHDGADQGLFDLPNTVDQPYNWTHSIHWSDQANPSTLFHLP